MQAVQFRPTTGRPRSAACLPASQDLQRRIENLAALKRVRGGLGAVRERNFQQVMARASTDAASGNPSDTAAAALALDLLALELCDD